MVDEETLIRRAVENWIVWRDTGEWDEFLALWHPRGRMIATWFRGPVREFVERSRQALGRNARAHHCSGGTAVRINGDRAVAESRMTLHLRTTVEHVLCDITCLGRFVDFMLRDDGRWLFGLRQPVYEKDWISPVDRSGSPQLDPALLARFPVGYRHLGYAQAHVGMMVDETLPGSDERAAADLKAQISKWLEGAPLDDYLSKDPSVTHA